MWAAALALGLVLAGCAVTIRRAEAPDPEPARDWSLSVRTANPSDRPIGPGVETVYALGDWGTGDGQQRRVAKALEASVATVPVDGRVPPWVIGMGDNVYERGLPRGPETQAEWGDARVDALLKATFGVPYGNVRYGGKRLVFHVVPGNHDHGGAALARRKPEGDVLLQETRAEQMFAGWWRYYPIDHDRAGVRDSNDFDEYAGLRRFVGRTSLAKLSPPERMNQPSRHVTLIAMDTQLMLGLYERADDGDRASRETLDAYWDRVVSIARASETTWRALVVHHPISSYGSHGERAWYERLIPTRVQDLYDDDYAAYIDDACRAMVAGGIEMLFAGHEHNLQILRLPTLHPDGKVPGPGEEFLQIISGSAAKHRKLDVEAAGASPAMIGFHDGRGFVRLDFEENRIWLEMIAPAAEGFRSLGVWEVEKEER